MMDDLLEQMRQIQERLRVSEVGQLQKQVAAFRTALPVSQEILRSIERTTAPIRDIQERTRRVNEAAKSIGSMHKQINEQFGFAFAQAVQVGAAIEQMGTTTTHVHGNPDGELSDLVGHVGRIFEHLQQVIPEDVVDNARGESDILDAHEHSGLAETVTSADNAAGRDAESLSISYERVLSTLMFLFMIWAYFFPNADAIVWETNIIKNNYVLADGTGDTQKYRELPQPIEYVITADARLRTSPSKTNDAVTTLNRGTIFVVTERYGDWNGGYVVNNADKRVWGWAYRRYMVRKELR